MRFLIWSLEHQAWWKPSKKGYTKNKMEAGVYTLADAAQICAEANGDGDDEPSEAMVPA